MTPFHCEMLGHRVVVAGHAGIFPRTCARFLKIHSDNGPIHAGAGDEGSIVDLAGLIATAVGYRKQPIFDSKGANAAARMLSDGVHAALLQGGAGHLESNQERAG